MSTLQNTHRHRHRIRTRLGTGILALSTLIAIGLALLILEPAGHRTTAETGSIASQAALTTQAPALADCLRDPSAHALACSHTAPAAILGPARTRCFRDPNPLKPLCTPAARKPAHHRPPHPPTGGVAP